MIQRLLCIAIVMIHLERLVDQIDIYHGSGDNWKKDTFDSLTAKYTGKSIEYDLVGLLKLELVFNKI